LLLPLLLLLLLPLLSPFRGSELQLRHNAPIHQGF
jgi:hypothetical protein